MAIQRHQVINQRNGNLVATSIEEASGPWRSFRGLMLRKGLPSGHGMVFRPAKGIHTQFMRFPIDLIFLDKQNQVVKIRPSMRPWRFDLTSAAAVIEMPSGSAAQVGLQTGDHLQFQPSSSETP